ncbi:MAG TPA: WD40 repeat domain-containing serine/threonine protein kinase, partial [Pirellulales bacterium]|nr:WD40 repeat domain-containing serine/threonine protein kinase [Pirellulales bacterium]
MSTLDNQGDVYARAAYSDDRQREARLDEAATEWLKAIEQGTVEQSAAADRQAWFDRYPEFERELAEFFAGEAELARLAMPLREVLWPLATITLPGPGAEALDWHPARTRFPIGDAARTFGEYELLAEIARGGMGVVFKARQTRLNRTVAIKMILSGQFAGGDDVRRFLAEAEAAAGLDHPGIVPVYECGQIEGQHFFSMAFVDGQSLSARLTSGPLPPRQAAELLAQVADAVAYAHSQGVIHRDLKPSNILIAQDGHPRVSDFGLAKTVAGDSGLTHSGDAIGTPGYMPPEQAAGRLADIGPASDIYALGAVLYAMLTVRPPFQAANPVDTLRQVLEQEPVAPRQLNPAVPRDLETIALACLQKDARRRYATADALAAELRRFARGEPIHARPISRFERVWRWCRRNRAVAGLTASVAALLVATTLVSTMAAFRLRAEQGRTSEHLQRAERAEHDALNKLRDSYLAQARAQRVNGAPGQRFESLRALREAVPLRDGPDLRDEAIACLALADLRPARRWPGYSNGATALTFDRAFKRYARSDSDGKLQVRSVEGDRLLIELPSPGPGEHVWILSFSPDGRHLAAVHHPHTIIHVWRLETKTLVLNQHIGRSFQFHRDGRLLAFLDHTDGAVTIYDLSAGKVVARFAPGATPGSFAFDPRGDQIAITLATPPCIGLFDLKTQRRERMLLVNSLPPATTTRLAFSPNGRLIAATRTDNKVYVCDVATGSVQAVLRGHQAKPTDAIFNAAGNLLATAGWDGTVRFWDPYAGKQLLLEEGAAGYQSARFSDDGRLFGPTISGSEVTMWHVATGSEACASLCRPSDGAHVMGADFSRDG